MWLQARLAGIFLLSLSAVYHAYAACHPTLFGKIPVVLWPPLVLGAATIAGAALHDRLAIFSERVGRERLRVAGWAGYSFVLGAAILGVTSGHHGSGVLDLATVMALILQPAFLALAGLGRGFIGAIVNALVLSSRAALEGGPAGDAALVSFTAFLAFFLVMDHRARKVVEYRVESLPGAGPAIARAALSAAMAAAPLLAFFALWPPRPAVPLEGIRSAPPLTPEQAARIYRDLAILILAGGIVFYLILRLAVLRFRGGGEAEVEQVAARRRAERIDGPPSVTPPAGEGTGWAGRIVRLYVKLLAQMARLGMARRADETPAEFGLRIAPAGDPARALTEVFQKARYGPGKATEGDYREASGAAAAVLTHYRRLERRG